MSDAMAITDARDLSQGAGAKPASTNAVEVKKSSNVAAVNAVTQYISNPLLRRALPGLVGLFGLLLFVVVSCSLTQQSTCYLGLQEAPRRSHPRDARGAHTTARGGRGALSAQPPPLTRLLTLHLTFLRARGRLR